MKIFKWKIPFRLLPASWGLSGNSFFDAKTRYEVDDEIEAERLIIKHRYKDQRECNKQIVEMEYARGVLTDQQYEKAKLEFIDDQQKRAVGTLAYLHKYGEITDDEYNKEICEIFNKPWIKIWWQMNVETGTIDMEIDHNEYFIKYLAAIQCPGNTPTEMVDAYVRQLARNVLDEEEPDEEGFIRVKEDGAGLKTYK